MPSKTPVNEIDAAIGANIRRIRTYRRISLEALGELLGVTYQQIQKYETGKNRVSAATLHRLATIWNVSPLELLPDAERHVASVGVDSRVEGIADALYKTPEPARSALCRGIKGLVGAYAS